jgi:hypothetical protein
MPRLHPQGAKPFQSAASRFTGNPPLLQRQEGEWSVVDNGQRLAYNTLKNMAKRANPSKGGGAKPRVYSREAMIAELPQVVVVTPSGEESQGVFVLRKGVACMLLLSRYKRKELSHKLIRIHESLVEDMITYFEKGKLPREKMKEAGKALKQALKLAKKKKINPGVEINQTASLLEVEV